MSEHNTPASTPGNPVIPVYAADPHTELFGNRYYIYAELFDELSQAQKY